MIQTSLANFGKTAQLSFFADVSYAVVLQKNTLCLCLVLLRVAKRTTSASAKIVGGVAKVSAGNGLGTVHARWNKATACGKQQHPGWFQTQLVCSRLASIVERV